MAFWGLIFCINVSAMEMNEISVQSEAWKHCSEPDGTGIFFDMLKLVYEPYRIGLKIKIVPYKRSIHNVKNEKIDLAVGAYPGEVANVIYPKWHFFVDDVSAVFLKSNPVTWQGEQSLGNKKVVWLLGYSYEKYIQPPMKKVLEVNDQKMGFRLLESGYYDFYIGPAVMIGPDLDPSKFQMEFIKWIKMYMIFQKTPRGKRLAGIWDLEFKKHIESGELKQLFKAYDMIKFYHY